MKSIVSSASFSGKSQSLTKSLITQEVGGESGEDEDLTIIRGPNREVAIPPSVWDEMYDFGLYLGYTEPTTPQREEYRRWVRDHQPFVVLPQEYYPPKPTPPDYSVVCEGKPLLYYGFAFTQDEAIDFAVEKKGLRREDIQPSNAVSEGYHAAFALVKHLSKEAGVPLELELPLSLKYHYVAAIFDTNNVYTKRVKTRSVTKLESLVKERFGADRDMRWWWDRDFTHPSNGHLPSWAFSRDYTGDAEGEEYDSSGSEEEE